MSVSLSAERDRIQREVDELEQNLSVTNAELDQLSSGTDDDSDQEDVDKPLRQSAAGLLAEKEKIQKEIKNLEDVLGPHNSIVVSDGDDSSSDESDLGLSPSVDSCLQMNLVYQQVVQETLDQLEKLLTQNQKEQKELVTQLSGPIKEPSKQQPTNSSYQQPMKMYLGRFLKPYFKDKLTGLGPPANPEAREKASRIAGCLDEKKLKIKRWESWQKTLLIHAVSREGLRRLIQPKLSKVDYLSQKLLSAQEADRQLIREQIDNLEREIDLLRQKKKEELIGDRYEEYDWEKISNIDFEGTRDAGDIRCFWQNFFHPSINKTRWSQEEVQQLKEISRRYGERHWEAVAQELGTGRTAFMCLQMYQRFVSDSLKRGSWTPAEDALLTELVDKMRIGNFIPYTQMSYFMAGRDPPQLIYRWNQVLDPSLKKGPWTKQEDKLLLQAVARHGEKNWWKIRLEVPGRTDGGCRDRYYDCLKAGTKRGPFDMKERELLLELVEKHGVGHWAKMAAEIPNRTDAQCMRAWRQMVKISNEKLGYTKKTSRRQRGNENKKKKVSKANKNIRRRLKAIKDEVISEEEEEEIEIEYMDTDDEKEQMKKTEGVEMEKLVEVQEEEELEEEYTFPPMQDWIPVERTQPFTLLSFRPAVLASSNEAHNFVRSTIVGKFGRSVIVGPQPRELQWEERHNSSAMMMVLPDQLRAHLRHQARRFPRKAQCKAKNAQTSKPRFMKGMTTQGIDLMLQAAVTPWIGNLLIPASTRTTAIDVLRERGEKKGLSSTSIFKLLLQVTNMDVMGCKEMIEQRQNGVIFLTPPTDPSGKLKNPNTVAGMLQRIKLEMQKLPEANRWHKRTPPSRLHPLTPPQNCPSLILQVPLNKSPQVVPVAFPQAVSIPHSVSQLNAASSPAQHTSPHAGVTISPFPALSTCQSLTTPPVFVVPVLQNVTATCSQQTVPLTQSLTASLPPFLNQPFSVGSTHSAVFSSPACPSLNCLSPTTLNPPREMEQAEDHESQNRFAHNGGDGEVGVNKDGKESQKASAPHQVTEAKAEVKKTTMSAPLKTASIQSSNFSSAFPLPPHQLSNAPIQQVPQIVCSSKATSPTAPAVDVISSFSLASLHLTPDDSSTSANLSVPSPQSATPSCSDRTVPSSLNRSLVPLSSSLASQHTVSSTPCPPDSFSSDHNYTFLTPGPTPIQHGSDLSQPCPVSNQPNTNVPVGQSRGKKRQREVIEKQQVMSNKDDQCVGKISTDVDGKRARKLTHKAKALQEDAQAKAEAKKKKTSTSSPQQKRSRSAGSSRSACSAHCACSKEKVNTKTPQRVVAQPPRLHLLPSQSMWVMTSTGLVQLAQVPPQGLEMAVINSVPPPSGNGRLPAPPPVQFPIKGLRLLAPKTFSVPLAQPSVQPTRLDHGCYALPFCPRLSSTSFSPRGTVRVDPPESRPFRKEMLQIDPSLMFLEPPASIQDWLSGLGGVVVPGEGEALPYLPPFVSNLSTLSALLRAKKSLIRSSLQLLREGNKPRWPQTSSKPDSSAKADAKNSSNEPPPSPPPQPLPDPPDLPDSTSDFTPASKQPAPSVSSDHPQQQVKKEEEEEEELVAAVRQLVAERFSSNPAYQLLKARFLSCFTVPALLATLPPETKVETYQTNQEEEEEEEEAEGEEEVELKKIKEMAKWRRAEKSKHLLCDTSGASASHFSGIIDVTRPTADQT